MTHKRMTIEEAVEYIQNDDSNDDFAFRGDDFVPVGKFRKSKYHGDGIPEYQLPGVSAVNIPSWQSDYIIKAIDNARRYGKNVFLLRGETRNADEITGDPNEVIMISHKIVCIVE